MARILYLYNAAQTYTDTVFQHIASFGRHSHHETHYVHHDRNANLDVDLSGFDAVGIHYSLRLPFDEISPSAEAALRRYDGLKILFIQDEYDHTQRAWYWIRELGIKLVFTVVPKENVRRVYHEDELPDTVFCSVLTGYVPENIEAKTLIRPPSSRDLLVGYRGRPLPVRYGRLGFEKVEIGRIVRTYCEAHGHACDIAWTEEARIYGTKWHEFVASCRSMLGSESGSNVFDFDGSLVERLRVFREQYPRASDHEVYESLIRPEEQDGLMNQVSPRVFEAIAMRTALVLFEGKYSGVLEPEKHYIALKKDGSNLREVFAKLSDGLFVDTMAERAFRDIIDSGTFNYKAFVATVDDRIDCMLKAQCNLATKAPVKAADLGCVTSDPIRAAPPKPLGNQLFYKIMGVAYRLTVSILSRLWMLLPLTLRRSIKSLVKRVPPTS